MTDDILARRSAPILHALVHAELGALADDFANAGFDVRVPAPAILQVCAAAGAAERPRVLLSVGIHGDETAPIEIAAQLLARLSAAPQSLAVDLMLVVGNPAAIAQGRRYLDADLNRQFDAQRPPSAGHAEARRAAQILRATEQFFATSAGQRWHLDLHTAIRASHYPSFAIVPEQVAGDSRAALLDWLAAAGTQAVVFSKSASGTFSACTAIRYGAMSCTAELGRVAPLGQNDLTRFAAAQAALLALLTGTAPAPGAMPVAFAVARELIKDSAAFRLAIADGTENFTPMARGALIAEDGGSEFRVEAPTEYVLFPNAAVAIGQRAGMMVVRLG